MKFYASEFWGYWPQTLRKKIRGVSGLTQVGMEALCKCQRVEGMKILLQFEDYFLSLSLLKDVSSKDRG